MPAAGDEVAQPGFAFEMSVLLWMLNIVGGGALRALSMDHVPLYAGCMLGFVPVRTVLAVSFETDAVSASPGLPSRASATDVVDARRSTEMLIPKFLPISYPWTESDRQRLKNIMSIWDGARTEDHLTGPDETQAQLDPDDHGEDGVLFRDRRIPALQRGCLIRHHPECIQRHHRTKTIGRGTLLSIGIIAIRHVPVGLHTHDARPSAGDGECSAYRWHMW